VLARHAVSVRGVVEPRRSTGAAAQRFSVDQRPIVPDSLRVTFAKRRAVATHWRERPDFDRSGPHARHFVVDHNAGAVLFGDGRAGDVPPAGGVITARWRVGGGPSGNLPVDTLTGVKDAGDLELQQSLPAWGGADAESLDAAKARAFARLRDERCAATLADLERVAKSAPGLPVAAAYAVTEHHPDIQCVPAAGCVTVVIVPLCVNYRREATAALCRALGRHVDARRPLGLEVHVTAARFSKVSVTAALALERRVDRGRVFAAAASALEQFLHPLRGGRDNNGWKAGRAVYRSEVLAQLQAVVGIRYVASLTLTADDASPTQCGDVVICPNGLVASGTHSFTAL
jgi:predicted phage baseplate assembly protein